MDKILSLATEYYDICIGISIFLILSLIGALADRSSARRFKINTQKMRTNVVNMDQTDNKQEEPVSTENDNNQTSGTTFATDSK